MKDQTGGVEMQTQKTLIKQIKHGKPGKSKHQPEPDEKATLAALKKELDQLHNGFEVTTDPVLIDSLIYQIMSVHMKYKFHLNRCRAGNAAAK